MKPDPNENGQFLPLEDEGIYVRLMAGVRSCVECGASFANNYRLFEHMIMEGHGKEDGLLQHFEPHMREFREFEKIWFRSHP